ncbi:MAG: response regulator [Pseudomonadales bacterium]|nr:response regulator [Pseudomonadales bacterium]
MAEPLIIIDQSKDYDLSNHIEAYLDHENKLSVEDVHDIHFDQFKTLGKNEGNFGFFTGTLWLRIKFKSEFSVVAFPYWLLVLGSPQLRELDLYQWHSDKLIREHHTGSIYPFDQREVKHPSWILRIAMQRGESEILVRIRSHSSVTIKAYIQPPPNLFESVSRENMFVGFVFGFFVVMLVYNAIVFVVTRERTFAIFSLLMFTAIIYRLSMTGLGFRFFWPENPELAEIITRMSASSTVALIAFFARDYLRLWEWNRWLDKTLLFCPLIVIIIFLGLPIKSSPGVSFAIMFTPPLLAFLASIIASQKGRAGAKLFLLGWFFFLACLGLGLLTLFGTLPQFLVGVSWTEIGLFFLIMLASLGLANRINEEKLMRVAADSKADTRSEFLANMSHEIRTPMNAIMGFSELALRENCSKEEKHFYLEQIGHSSANLLGILNLVLDLSKIEAGKLQIETVEFNLGDLIENLAAQFRPILKNKNFKLHVVMNITLPTNLIGDSLRIRQVLTNLLSNAIKFTEHGSVTMQVDIANGSELIVIVEDTGLGISKSQIKDLFEPFSQADTSTTRIFGGTGLGLSIVKQLLELMGGTINVTSTPAVGTKFTVTIPVKIVKQIVQIAPLPLKNQDQNNQLENCRVLLVEDNSINQLLATTILKKAGMPCTIAENGKEAVDAIQKGEFDIVLMDIQMPVMDGLEATRQIRQIHKNHSLPIIGLTANAMEQDRQACMDVGMNDFIAKPFKTQLLFETIRKWHLTMPVG